MMQEHNHDLGAADDLVASFHVLTSGGLVSSDPCNIATHIYVGVECAAALRGHDVVLQAAGHVLVEHGGGRGRRRRRRLLLLGRRGLGRLQLSKHHLLSQITVQNLQVDPSRWLQRPVDLVPPSCMGSRAVGGYSRGPPAAENSQF